MTYCLCFLFSGGKIKEKSKQLCTFHEETIQMYNSPLETHCLWYNLKEHVLYLGLLT